MMMTMMIKLVLFSVSALSWVSAQRPNFVIMQPDDYKFFEEHIPPAHLRRETIYHYPDYMRDIMDNLPNTRRLMNQGVRMQQAYTVSPKCGTSRFSTITGRYPSRSAYGRDVHKEYEDDQIPAVGIPTTKLQDINYRRRDTDRVPDTQDCSHNNLAVTMKNAGYHTAVTGKWHLTQTDGDFDYGAFVNDIKDCGFDEALGVYAENLDGMWTNNSAFSHNMEYITDYAVKFIESVPADEQFFLYYNPSVPHGSGNVLEALTNYTCLDTPEGGAYGTVEPDVPGMTMDIGCEAYRQTVLDRAADAGYPHDNDVLGSIWIDDGIGALLTTLQNEGRLDNTFFLFQMDHGQEAKDALWEGGVRIAQFVHFPAQITPGSVFPGIVGTIDIAPTVLDYAGIAPTYDMDGTSWRNAVDDYQLLGATDETDWFVHERCLFFEIDTSRAVRCGCDKYMLLADGSSTYRRASFPRSVPALQPEMLADICDGTGSGLTVSSNGDNTGRDNVEGNFVTSGARFDELQDLVQQHLLKVHANRDTMDFTPLGPVYTP